MSLKTLLTKNAWNEQHAENINLLKKNGLGNKSGISRDFVKYADNNGMNIRKEPLTQEFIDEYINQKEDSITEESLIIKEDKVTKKDIIMGIIAIILLGCIIYCTIASFLNYHPPISIENFIGQIHI